MNGGKINMRRNWLAIGMIIAVVTLMTGAAACSSSKKSSSTPTPTTSMNEMPTAGGQTPAGSAQSEVTVTLVEYQMKPNVESVPAGSVTFNGKNIGGAEHALHVFKTDLAPDALPTKADGSVDEEAGVEMIDHVTGIQPQQAKSLTVNLAPGTYVLVCNVVQTTNGVTISHYEKGMHVAFTVTQ